jgi:hypothetical protein
MDLSRLQELKRRLVHEKDFMKVWGFFLDEFATDLEFIKLGEPIKHHNLELAVAQIGLQMFPRDGTITMVGLIHLADQHLIHGNVNVAGRVGGVLFFEDIRVGLVAVSDHFPSDETKFARFSTAPDRPRPKPSRN